MNYKNLSLTDRFFWADKLINSPEPYHHLKKAIELNNKRRVEWILQERPDALCAFGEMVELGEEDARPTDKKSDHFRGEELVLYATELGYIEIADALKQNISQYPPNSKEREQLATNFCQEFNKWFSQTAPFGEHSASNPTSKRRTFFQKLNGKFSH